MKKSNNMVLGVVIASSMCLLYVSTAEAGFGKKFKKSWGEINSASGYETPQQHQARRRAEMEAARRELEAKRLLEVRLARQSAYERARSDVWNRFQTTMSETIQPVLGAAKDDCPDAYSELNAIVVAMQDGFRALPTEEDDAGSAAQKLLDWEKGIASLIESAKQTKGTVEKRRAEMAEVKRQEAERLAAMRFARQSAYEKARSDAWNRFQTTMSETIQPVLGAAKDDCPDAYSELNAVAVAMQDGFRALPTEEDDAGSAAQKLSDWEKGIASLIESAKQTVDVVEKRHAELAKAELERMLAVLSKLSDLHAAKRHDGTSEFTNRMAWATGNKLWATEREVATEVRKRTGLELKDCTPAAKEFQSQRIKYLDAAAKCKYEFGSLSATGEVFLVSAEWIPNDEPQLVSNVLAAIKDYYQFPTGVCEREDRVITGYNLDSGNLSPWGLYQFNYFTKCMDDGDAKANKNRDRIANIYSIKPYVQTTTTFSCDGYDIVVKSDERGDNVVSVKTTDTVAYSEIKKNN